MKHFFYTAILIFLAFTNDVSAQVFQNETVHGRQVKRVFVDSSFRLPIGLATRMKGTEGLDSAGMLALKDTTDGVYYFTGARWKQLVGTEMLGQVGGGTYFNGTPVVSWNGTGYSYTVSVPSYYINNVLYPAFSQVVVLGDADETFDRYDFITATTSGTIVAVEGIPSSTPLVPPIDGLTSIGVSIIQVKAGEAEPTVARNLAYVEGAEWDTVASTHPSFFPENLNWVATDEFYSGNKSIKFGSTTRRNDIALVHSGTINTAEVQNLTFMIKLSNANLFNGGKYIWVVLGNGNTSVGGFWQVKPGSFGMTATTAWQKISIPITGSNVLFDKITLVMQGAFGSAIWIDDVILQESGLVITTDKYFTQVGADAGSPIIAKNDHYNFNIKGAGGITTETIGDDIIITGSGGGGGGENFANTDLTATGNRTHTFEDKWLDVFSRNSDFSRYAELYLDMDNAMLASQSVNGYSSIYANANSTGMARRGVVSTNSAWISIDTNQVAVGVHNITDTIRFINYGDGAYTPSTSDLTNYDAVLMDKTTGAIVRAATSLLGGGDGGSQGLQQVALVGNKTSEQIWANGLVVGDTTADIEAENTSIVSGRTENESSLSAFARGAFAHGEFIDSSTGFTGAYGAEVAGRATNSSFIISEGAGTKSFGYAEYSSTIRGSGIGSLVGGYLSSASRIYSEDNGSIVMGFAYSDSLYSTDNTTYEGGSIVMGRNSHNYRAYSYLFGKGLRNYDKPSFKVGWDAGLPDGLLNINPDTFYINHPTLYIPNAGTPSAGKVLTSDENGLATWEYAGGSDGNFATASSSGTSGVVHNLYNGVNVQISSSAGTISQTYKARATLNLYGANAGVYLASIGASASSSSYFQADTTMITAMYSDPFANNSGFIADGKFTVVASDKIRFNSFFPGMGYNVTAASASANSVLMMNTSNGDVGYHDGGALGKSGTPTSTADASGVNGEIWYDASFIYIKTGAGWKRSALSTF